MNLKCIAARPRKVAYAPIQLRYAIIRVRDGLSFTGTLNPSATASPTNAPTINVTGGGSTGGSLQAGTYYMKYTYVNATGETLPSPESAAFTVVAGNIPLITLPALPGGVTSINVYTTAPNGLSNSETLYLSNITTTTESMFIPYAASAVVPPDINTTGGYAVGISTMSIVTTTVVETGIQFTVGGDYTHTTYTIVSHTEVLGVTTSITFTPVLQQAASAGEEVTFGPHILYVKVGEGNLTYDEKRPIIYVRDREMLDTVRLGPDEPMDVKLEFTWEFLTAVSGSGIPTIEDALKQRGVASNWVTTSDDPCEPYCVDLEVEYVPHCPGVEREIISFNSFRYESLAHDIKQAQVSITGKCNLTQPTDVRAA